MAEFLNRFISKHKEADEDFLRQSEEVFTGTVDLVRETFGSSAFRPERSLNAAVFDSVMVGLANRIDSGPIQDTEALFAAYSELFEDDEYISAISAATSNEKSVETRITKAIQAFADI